jgi:rhodanese-related sulfurtransferase
MMTIDVETLRVWLEERRPVTILDVRPTAEWAEWAIAGSIHVNAYDALRACDPAALADVDAPSDGPVVTVCAAGKTSQIAAEQLAARGIEVRIIKGGELAEWLSVVFFWKTSDRGVRGLGTLKALQMGRQRIRENRGSVGGKADQRSEASQLNIRQINEQVPAGRRVSTPFPNRCFFFGWRPAFSQALDDFLARGCLAPGPHHL